VTSQKHKKYPRSSISAILLLQLCCSVVHTFMYAKTRYSMIFLVIYIPVLSVILLFLVMFSDVLHDRALFSGVLPIPILFSGVLLVLFWGSFMFLSRSVVASCPCPVTWGSTCPCSVRSLSLSFSLVSFLSLFSSVL
jgi:hypothetical protein